MFANLNREIDANGMSLRSVSAAIGMPESTFRKKIYDGDFSISEAFKIKERVFPKYSLNYLFKKTEWQLILLKKSARISISESEVIAMDSILVIVFAFMYTIAIAQKMILQKRLYELNQKSEEREGTIKEALEFISFFIACFMAVVRLHNILFG